MVPDFEYFIRMKPYSIYSHTLAGLFWFDVPLGLFLLFIYNKLIRGNFIDNLPAALNRSFSAYKSVKTTDDKWVRLLMVLICLFTGASSHLLWDAFTHVNGYFVTGSLLADTLNIIGHKIPIFKILQHSSTLAGFLVMGYAVKQLPAGNITHTKTIAPFWASVLIITIAIVTIRIVTGISIYEYGTIITSGITGFITGLLFTSIYYGLIKPNSMGQ